jgi:hypothetical protein
MPDSPPQRLGSFYLEDLAIIALSASVDQDTLPMHLELDDDRRARLRSRIKQLGRHDWPSSLREDPLLRRGYTLRQCCRLIAALMLLDAHLAPSDTIALAKANELSLLRAMAPRLRASDAGQPVVGPDDLLVVVPLGELVSLVAAKRWRAERPQAMRLIRRSDLPSLWSADADLGFPGQRLAIDVGLAAAAAWWWMLERNLMNESEGESLLAEIAAASAKSGFSGASSPVLRQR